MKRLIVVAAVCLSASALADQIVPARFLFDQQIAPDPIKFFGYKGASTAGPIYISATYGDGVTDATSVIQAAINNSTIGGETVLSKGIYLISGLTIPEGRTLRCTTQSAELLYTGSGTAITLNGTAVISNCNITKQSTVGGTGIAFETVGSAARAEYNFITNFTRGIYFHGSVGGGVYFAQAIGNYIYLCTTGIDSNSNGAATVNSVTIRDNTIQHVTNGINICGACIGNLLQRNDVEFPEGSNGIFINIQGDGNILIANWLEVNAIGTATNMTGLAVSGRNNTLIGNVNGSTTTGAWTSTSIDNRNFILNPYDFSSGAVVPDWRSNIPQANAGYLYGFLAAGSITVDASSCTGATIGSGSNNYVGKVTGLPTGVCTVKLTFANSATSTNGWNCAVSNLTHPVAANVFQQSTSTTTTVTFSGTSVANDVLSYGPCVAW